MIRKLCLLLLVCVLVMLVKSESSIEVDANGDEYEVKRFNIQGRQLNEGRSQCVVTRRKRAANPKTAYSGKNSNVEVDGKDAIKDEEQLTMIFYAPPIVAASTENEGYGEEENEQSVINMNEMNTYKVEDIMNNMEESNKNKSEESEGMAEDEQNKDDEEEGDDDVIKVIQLPIAAISSPSTVPDSDTDGIVLVHSQVPPRVNSQTHAVFELVPVNYAGIEEDEVDDNEDEDTEVDFDFKEELTPITTTAIWSTGDDGLNDLYDDYGSKPITDQTVVKKTRKPLKANKKKTSLKPKRKNKYNNNFRRGLTKGDKKRGNNKRRYNKTGVHRPIKNGKIRRGNATRNHNSQKNKNNMIRAQNKKQNKNIRNTVFNNNKAKKNKNRNNAHILDQGLNTFTRTMTTTQTGDEDDNNNVNCIIIRKDAPPTTERPFWNIFGRSANDKAETPGPFGLRKRVNARFVV